MPKPVIKNQSKSLYYYNSQNRTTKGLGISILNSTGANILSHNVNQQTLNEELMGF